MFVYSSTRLTVCFIRYPGVKSISPTCYTEIEGRAAFSVRNVSIAPPVRAPSRAPISAPTPIPVPRPSARTIVPTPTPSTNPVAVPSLAPTGGLGTSGPAGTAGIAGTPGAAGAAATANNTGNAEILSASTAAVYAAGVLVVGTALGIARHVYTRRGNKELVTSETRRQTTGHLP
jgi:hypothetical protein